MDNELRMRLEQIVSFEHEHTFLDFKQSQYSKESKSALLTDLIAMANAHGNENRYIIVGVKYFPHGDRTYHPIDLNNFVDDAEYQDLVRSNIEPELKFSYMPFYMNEQLLGIFTIETDDEQKPYMMKKDFGDKLKAGDSYIRIGSHHKKMNLADYNAIYAKRHKISKEREIMISHLHFFIKELMNNEVVLYRLESYLSEGPNILELFDPANELCDHFIFEMWDTFISSGFISTLEFEDKEHCRYAIKTVRDVRREIKTVSANWRRLLKWYEFDRVQLKMNSGQLKQIIPPEVSLKSSMPGCISSVKIALDAVGNALLVLRRLYDKLQHNQLNIASD